MRKLSKRDVEALLSDYDKNPVDALHTALRLLISDCPTEWVSAIDCLPCDEQTKDALRQQNISALDSLVKQLVETRTL